MQRGHRGCGGDGHRGSCPGRCCCGWQEKAQAGGDGCFRRLRMAASAAPGEAPHHGRCTAVGGASGCGAGQIEARGCGEVQQARRRGRSHGVESRGCGGGGEASGCGQIQEGFASEESHGGFGSGCGEAQQRFSFEQRQNGGEARGCCAGGDAGSCGASFERSEASRGCGAGGDASRFGEERSEASRGCGAGGDAIRCGDYEEGSRGCGGLTWAQASCDPRRKSAAT